MSKPLEIRSADTSDALAISQIYNHYIRDTVVTFEVDEVSTHEMATRITKVHGESLPWLVAESGGVVLGYAYASPWHHRYAFRFSVEMTVYLAPGMERRGTGSTLYRQLIGRLDQKRVHTLIGGIALPNAASVALHEKFGFVKAAHYHEVGFKFDRWIDVGYWERLL